MYIVSNHEMREMDRCAIEQWEIPSVVLMETAGMAVVRALFDDFPNLAEQRVTILAGAGNNGGDGLVIARHLHMQQVSVSVLIINEGGDTSTDHATNRRILDHMPVRVFQVDKPSQIKLVKAILNHTDIVLDCVFGTGLSRDVSDFVSELFDIVNEQRVERISIDTPSGLDGDTGAVRGNAICADRTYALAWPKKGFYLPGAGAYLGALMVLPIGIPTEVADAAKPALRLLRSEDLVSYLKPRPQDSHKGMYGHVGLIAGSIGMSGACVLAAQGALRAGCGLVTALVDKSIYMPVATNVPEAMVRPVVWPNEANLDRLMARADVLIIGPGMGTGDEKKDVLQAVLSRFEKVLIIDADALTLLAELLKEQDHLKESKAQIILTPHPGEMARLTQSTTQAVQQDRIDVALAFAKAHGCTVALKGHHTIIAAADGRAFINGCDAPALATAGSGDVLTGTIAAMAAGGMDAPTAASVGVLLHGMAGVRCAEEHGVAGTVAGDIAKAVAQVLQSAEQRVSSKG